MPKPATIQRRQAILRTAREAIRQPLPTPAPPLPRDDARTPAISAEHGQCGAPPLSAGGTPLYDQAVVLLATATAKARELRELGKRTHAFTVLITDGEDTCSSSATSDSVACIVRDLQLGQDHIVAAIGIHNGRTDYHKVFEAMGIPRQWILTPDSSASAVLKAIRKLAGAFVLAAGSDQAFRAIAELGPSSPAGSP